MIEIPLSSVIIQNQPNSDENGESQNPQDPQNESIDEPTMIGLGPLRTANKLWIKQRIRASDILSNLTGCEVEKKFNIHGSEGEVLYSAKGQLISKELIKVFICTKKRTIFFCISALASKKRSNQKIRALYTKGTNWRILF